MSDRPTIKIFLSHSYKAPEINLYFFDLFSEAAELQFEVDDGVLATSVTRLERAIRDADAFVGVYPFPGPASVPSVDELRQASRYFRLELDIALRSRKPALVYCGRRYGRHLDCSPS